MSNTTLDRKFETVGFVTCFNTVKLAALKVTTKYQQDSGISNCKKAFVAGCIVIELLSSTLF